MDTSLRVNQEMETSTLRTMNPEQGLNMSLVALRSRMLVILSLRYIAQIILRMADALDQVHAFDHDSELQPVAESSNVLLVAETELESLDQPVALPDRTRCDSLTSECSVDSGCTEAGEDLLLDEETGLELVSLEEVRDHCTPWDAWTVVYDRVYDVTEYLARHPGGEEVMMEYVGYDATIAFRGVGHSQAAFRALEKYLVGILPISERLNYEKYED